MKRIILIGSFSFALTSLLAQPDKQNKSDINGVEAPAIVVDKFKADHPNINPLWGMQDDNFSAGYRDEINNTEKIVVYDRYGNIVEINNEVVRAAHPKAIDDYYNKHHPTEKNYKVYSSEDAKGKKTFYSKNKNGTLYFDKNGKYLRTEQDKTKATPTYKPNPNQPK
jgi:hypothetical protein